MKTFLLLILFCQLSFAKNLDSYVFTDIKNQKIDLNNQKFILSFVFTRCQMANMCPLTISKFRKLHAALLKKKNSKINLYLISLDPSYDTATVLKKFSKDQKLEKDRIKFLITDLESTDEFLSAVGLVKLPGANFYQHKPLTIIYDTSFKEIKRFETNDWSDHEIINAFN